MRRFLDAVAGATTSVPGAEVRLSASGELLVTTEAGDTLRAQVTDEVSTSGVELWFGPTWLVAAPVEGHRLVSYDLHAGTVAILTGLARLDLPGYDPGGLHRVDFFDLADERRLLVETEVAVLSIDTTSIRWQLVHGDVTCRVRKVQPDRAVMECEGSQMSVRLRDGVEILD